MILLNIFVFLIGLCFGSFINVLIWRFGKKKNILGRSICDKCKRKLHWWENIPLISFLILRGKCRTCHSPIPSEYPLVEISTGLIFLLTFGVVGLTSPYLTVLYLLISSILFAIVLFDLHYQIIPDWSVVTLIIVTLLLHLLANQVRFVNCLLTAFIASGFFLFLYLVTKGKGLGFGDVKFAFFVGFFLGFPKAVLALYLAFVVGAILGTILILFKRKKFGQRIPFGPFLILGVFISWFLGERIIILLKNAFGY